MSRENRRRELSQSEVDARRKKRQKKKRARRRFMLTVLLFILIASSFFTPIYNVKEIVVKGNEKVLHDTILARMEIPLGTNIWRVSRKDAARRIEAEPYIASATVDMEFPNRLIVNVTESKLSAYVKSAEEFIAVDELANALEKTDTPLPGYPVVIGTEVKEITFGEEISVDDQNKFDIIILYIEELRKMDRLSMITQIDLTEMNLVKLTVENRIVAIMGDTDKLTYKLDFLFTGFATFLPNQKGELDLRNLPKAPFKPY